MSTAISRTIPKYLQGQQIRNFTGQQIENPQKIANGGITSFDWETNIRELRFTAPKQGHLIASKSHIVLDITVTSTGAETDSKPLEYVQSLFHNKYYIINGQEVENNNGHHGYFHSLMSNVHYESEFVSNSSGYKVGNGLKDLATGSTLRLYLPLVNAKYLDHEGLLRHSFNLGNVESFEVVYELSSSLKDFTSGANVANVNIRARMEWYVLHSPELVKNQGLAPIRKTYTRYHRENRIVESGTTEIEHEFIPKYSNLKYILVCQRTSAVASGTGTEKYRSNFVQNSLDKANVYIDGKAQFNNSLALSYMTTYIDLMEKTFGRDISKPLGTYMDFTQSANLGKAFLCIPLSLDTKNSSGKNTKTKSKSLTFRANCNITAQTYFEYFFVYDEICQINPMSKQFVILS